jgi:hypothetical protein
MSAPTMRDSIVFRSVIEMALNYFPLISRAVARLEKNTGESRRALYDGARSALLSQLRRVVPALDEHEITRERLALEEAIRLVEVGLFPPLETAGVGPLTKLVRLIEATDLRASLNM